MITHSKYPCARCDVASECKRTAGCGKWVYWFTEIWDKLQKEADYLRSKRK